MKIQGIFCRYSQTLRMQQLFVQTALPPLPALNIIEPQFLPLGEQNLHTHFLDASGGRTTVIELNLQY